MFRRDLEEKTLQLWVDFSFVSAKLMDEDLFSKVEELLFHEDEEYIQQGLELLLAFGASELCRTLVLQSETSLCLRGNIEEKSVSPDLLERCIHAYILEAEEWKSIYDLDYFRKLEIRVLGQPYKDLRVLQKELVLKQTHEMVLISGGEFMMGALPNDDAAFDEEKPHHKVEITKDFYVGKYLVTQALWEFVMRNNPSEFKGASHPVECVTWFDCVEFCNKLSELEGKEPVYTIKGENVACNWKAKGYRLLTEAEWEYAARGGENYKYAGSDDVDEVAWYDEDLKEGSTHPVGLKKPNGFGLYDMSGNVWERCWDLYDKGEYQSRPIDGTPTSDPLGATSGSYRVDRGGGWIDIPELLRVSLRSRFSPTIRDKVLGFRLGLSL